MMIGIAAVKNYLPTACQIVGKKITDESFEKGNLYLADEDVWKTSPTSDFIKDTIYFCENKTDEGKVFIIFKLPEEYQSEENETAINYMKAKLFDFCLKNPYDLTTFVGFDFRIYYV